MKHESDLDGLAWRLIGMPSDSVQITNDAAQNGREKLFKRMKFVLQQSKRKAKAA
jgi:hypothetical protein